MVGESKVEGLGVTESQLQLTEGTIWQARSWGSQDEHERPILVLAMKSSYAFKIKEDHH
jgi:hypothetical protein